MTFLQIYLIIGGVILGVMTLLWLLSLIPKNSSIVDIFWGFGFVTACWVYFALTPDGFIQRKLLIAVLVTIWGMRLTLHILRRNWGKGEDFRYQKWRNEHGKIWWLRSFFQVFMLQGLLLWVISTPLLAAQYPAQPDRLILLDFIGAFVWLIGFFFESVGDYQLSRFIKNPENKGKIMTSGVWRYTRHPNYFGDSAQWWGYYLIATAAGGWWTVFSPIIMTVFLLKVSGVALLEKTMQTRLGYQEYMQKTSAFVPWFPRKN